jgi:cell division protein FtsB
LAVLGVIVLLYASPVKHWIVQSRTYADHRAELRRLERENAHLKVRAASLSRPDVVEREARKLGMVRRGEQAFVIENFPSR